MFLSGSKYQLPIQTTSDHTATKKKKKKKNKNKQKKHLTNILSGFQLGQTVNIPDSIKQHLDARVVPEKDIQDTTRPRSRVNPKDNQNKE